MIPPSGFARSGRLLSTMLRVCAVAGLVLFCLWQMQGQLAHLRAAVILDALGAVSGWQWLGSLVAVTVAFLAVGGQERAVLAHLGLRIPPAEARRAAMASAAVSQTMGFGPVVGAVVRRRLLPDLSLLQSAAVSAAITVGFFAGLGAVGALSWVAARPPGDWLVWAAPALGLPLLLVRALPRGLRAHLPHPVLALRFGMWLTVDLSALALACWIVMPSAALSGTGLLDFLTIFLLALGAGLASGSPAGTGPFEAMMLNGLDAADPSFVVAGIMAFRGVAYAIPAICGAVWALAGPRLCPPRPAPQGLTPAMPGAGWLRRLPRAEVQLALQGTLGLSRLPCGAVWLTGQAQRHAVHMGDPVPRDGRRVDAMAAVTAAMQADRPACLYRVGPRLAAAARRQGLAVLPISHEAVIDTAAFTTCGPQRAGLRRKLRHAASAGVVLSEPSPLPLAEMAEVAAIWSARHGGERGFSMGRFSPDAVALQRVILARDGSGQLLGFMTFHVSAGEWVLDLIRARDRLPDGTLYLIVDRAIALARADGVPRLSLACVPLPGWGLRGPAARLARRLTARTGGLQQFKSAFRPVWERRYLVARGRLGLPLAGLALSSAIRPAPAAGRQDAHPPRPAPAAR